MSSQEKRFAVPEKVLVATLQYLAQKPYGEVSKLVEILRCCEQVDDSAKTDEKEVEK